MFRRRAGQGGNVSLLDQDNVVLNQINITTLSLLSGEFMPRINSYRNQRFFSYKHSRHLICLMQRNILLFLFSFFNLHHLGFKILHLCIYKIIPLSHLFIGWLINVPGLAATDQVYDASHRSNRYGGRRDYDTGC